MKPSPYAFSCNIGASKIQAIELGHSKVAQELHGLVAYPAIGRDVQNLQTMVPLGWTGKEREVN